MKKLWAGISVIAIAFFSGAMLSKFLNWAGELEVFDFDLDDSIEDEEL